MPARRPVRWAFPGATAVVLACAALAGCSGGSAGSPGGAAAPSVSSSPAGHTSASAGKLTGNFCTDFKNIGNNMPIPAGDSGSLSTLEQRDGRYLRQVAAYYDGLAAEAPSQAGKEMRIISSAYQQLAGSVAAGTTGSISRIEQQITALTTNGVASRALRQLVTYVTTKCA